MALKIAVMGSGGVGGFFGARLAQAGSAVTFVARGAHLQAIAANGLRVDSKTSPTHVKPARCVEQAADAGPVDVVMFCVNALVCTRLAASGLSVPVSLVSVPSGVSAQTRSGS